MRYISIEELLQLAKDGIDLVGYLENELLNDAIGIFDNHTGKTIWYIYDKDSLLDSMDIIEDALKPYLEDKLLIKYYYRYSLDQYSFYNDKIHTVKVYVYLMPNDYYKVIASYDDGTVKEEIITNVRKLKEKIAWHGYGRVLYIAYIDYEEIPKEILEYLEGRGSWTKFLVKDPV